MSNRETSQTTLGTEIDTAAEGEVRAKDLTWSGFDPAYRRRLSEHLENARVATVCPDVRNHALGSLIEVEAIRGIEMFFRSGCVGYHRENHTLRMRLTPHTDASTVAHEFAHTVHMSHGWDVQSEGRGDNTASEENGFYTYSAYPEAYYLATGRPLAAGKREDMAVDTLALECNLAFRRLYRANVTRDRADAEALDFGHPYSGYNAAETFAKLHEHMQTDDTAEAKKALASVREHDSRGGNLLTAYLRVFNPSPTVARLLTDDEIAAAN